MKIRYKVVVDVIRLSAIVNIKRYQLRYFKDTVVEAPAGTLGIMVFRRRYQAKQFILRLPRILRLIIIRVEPLGRGTTPQYIARRGSTYSDELDIFYKTKYVNKKFIGDFGYHYPNVNFPVEGTLCYDYVRVID